MASTSITCAERKPSKRALISNQRLNLQKGKVKLSPTTVSSGITLIFCLSNLNAQPTSFKVLTGKNLQKIKSSVPPSRRKLKASNTGKFLILNLSRSYTTLTPERRPNCVQLLKHAFKKKTSNTHYLQHKRPSTHMSLLGLLISASTQHLWLPEVMDPTMR